MINRADNSNLEFIRPTEVGDRQDTVTNREDFRTYLGEIIIGTIHLEEGQGMDKSIEVGQGSIQIIEVITEIKGIGDKTIIEMDSRET